MTDDVRKTKGSVVQRPVEHALSKLGQDISFGRRARKIGVESFAQRMGVSRATLHRLERGDPGISLNTLAMALHALGRLDALMNIADPADDDVAIMQMRDQAPKRIGKPRRRLTVPDLDDVENIGNEPENPQSKYVGF